LSGKHPDSKLNLNKAFNHVTKPIIQNKLTPSTGNKYGYMGKKYMGRLLLILNDEALK